RADHGRKRSSRHRRTRTRPRNQAARTDGSGRVPPLVRGHVGDSALGIGAVPPSWKRRSAAGPAPSARRGMAPVQACLSPLRRRGSWRGSTTQGLRGSGKMAKSRRKEPTRSGSRAASPAAEFVLPDVTGDGHEPGPFPVVGIGASAGGLEAMSELLRWLPTDTGMAFVFVPHLDPTHRSLLAEILARATSMPVTEVADELRVEPNHAYIIPPG